MKIFPVE